MKLSQDEIEELESKMLDDFCSAILILLWKGKKMRFNEIHRELQMKGTTLSKPTLSEHLKHLMKKKWITRKVEGVQNVSYQLHKSINRPSKAESDRWLEDILSTLKIQMIAPSPEEKVNYALTDILKLKLEELAFRIAIEPEIQNQSLSFTNSRSRLYENDLISECNRDEKYRKAILAKSKEILKILNARLPQLPDSE